jgi:hypothetical protein
MTARQVWLGGLAAVVLWAAGPAWAQILPEDNETEKRSRIAEEGGTELSRVDSIPIVVGGVQHDLKAVVLVTDKQVCAAATAGNVSRRNQDPGELEDMPYVSNLLAPRFGLENLDAADFVGMGYIANGVLMVDARRAETGEGETGWRSSEDLAASVEASTSPCRAIGLVKYSAGSEGDAADPETFPVAVAVSIGDQPTLTVIEPDASYTLDRDAFRRIDLAAGPGQGSIVPAYARSLSWQGQ